MKILRLVETLLHVGGWTVLLYGVIVTVFVIAGFTDARPMGLHPIRFGLIFAAAFSMLGGTLLGTSYVIRRWIVS